MYVEGHVTFFEKYLKTKQLGAVFRLHFESLQSLIFKELERQENVMVICHQAVLRCLLAYFQDKSSGMTTI